MAVQDWALSVYKNIEKIDYVNLRDAGFRAMGDGVTDDWAIFASANAASGSKFIPPGSYRIATNITLSGDYHFASGAVLKPDTGVVITLNLDSIDAPTSAIFDLSNGGSVVFAATSRVRAIHPEWFGASGDGVTDDTTEVQAALATNKPVFLSPGGIYRINSNVTLTGHLRSEAGSMLRPASGVVITLNVSSLHAPFSQIFDLSQGGSVVFSATSGVSEVYTEWWGATGNGSTEDSAAVQAGMLAGKAVHFLSHRTYRIRNINLSGSRRRVYAPPGSILRNNFTDGSNMFNMAQTALLDFLDFEAGRIDMSNAAGGHIFNFMGTMNHSKISVMEIRQSAPGKSIIYVDDTNFFFNSVSGLFWQIESDATEPAIRIWSTGNKVAGCKFDINVPQNSGTRHYMELLLNGGAGVSYNSGNYIRLQDPESCNGGALKIKSATNTLIDLMTCHDTGTLVNHMIEIGEAARVSRNIKINGYQRTSGILNPGIVDIFIDGGEFIHIMQPGGLSVGNAVTVDVNNNTDVIVIPGAFLTIINEPV